MAKEEFLEIYDKLDPIGRADLLSWAAFALEIQKGTERRCLEAMAKAQEALQEALKEDYGISDEQTKQPTDNRPAA